MARSLVKCDKNSPAFLTDLVSVRQSRLKSLVYVVQCGEDVYRLWVQSCADQI